MNSYTRAVRPVFLALCVVAIMTTSHVIGSETIGEQEWNLTLIGEHESNISQSEFEESMNSNRASNQFASVVDSEGRVWDGIPLALLTARVDDTNEYAIKPGKKSGSVENAFNIGDTITVVGSDGSQLTLNSDEITRNNDYIIANAVNGNPLRQTDSPYPLILVGNNLKTENYINGVTTITVNSPGSIF